MAAFGSLAALVASGLVAATGSAPSAHAAPGGDCAVAYPLADLVDDLAAGPPVQLQGLTVVRGTTPVAFAAEVIGILEDGIAPDVDMIMVDVDVPDVGLGPANQPSGIWQGMSGSPLYAADGRLVGAISYGLSYGPSPIAGVTPFEAMDEHLSAPAAREHVTLPRAAARRMAASGGAASALGRAGGPVGLTRLDPGLTIAGVGARRLGAKAAKRPWAIQANRTAGRSSAPATAASIVAGGNLATSVAYGDVTIGGVGTTTSVCDGRVVGFGHPADFLGTTTRALQPADTVYVQSDSAGAPFKVANMGAPVGTVTDDRLTGIAGSLDGAPAGALVAAAVSLGSKSRTGRTDVYVSEALAMTAYSQIWTSHDRVLDGDPAGSMLTGWKITGTDAAKRPFSLGLSDRFAGHEGVDEVATAVADLVWALDRIEGVTVTGVASTSTVSRPKIPLRVARLEQRRAGAWVRVARKAPIETRRGRIIKLRVVLAGGEGPRTVPVQFRAPSPRVGKVKVAVTGGAQLWSSTDTSSIASIRKSLAASVRNDVVKVDLGTPDKLGGGEEISVEDLMGMRASTSFVRTRTSAPQPHLVNGTLTVPVRIRR